MTLLLKKILMESKMYSYTIPEILENSLKFDGKTLIFLDTESTGLDPSKFFVQPTQVSILVIDGSSWNILERYSVKIKLRNEVQQILSDPSSDSSKKFNKESDRWVKKYKKPITPIGDLLKTSNYFGSDKYVSEVEALESIDKIFSSYKDIVVVAHNATFDMNIIQTARRVNNLRPMKKYPVFDTVKLARYFFVPLLVSMESNEVVKNFLETLLSKTTFKSYGTSLDKLAKVFQVKADNWHDAEQDTETLFQVLKKMIEFLKDNKDVDIRKYQGKQAKRFRHM